MSESLIRYMQFYAIPCLEGPTVEKYVIGQIEPEMTRRIYSVKNEIKDNRMTIQCETQLRKTRRSKMVQGNVASFVRAGL